MQREVQNEGAPLQDTEPYRGRDQGCVHPGGGAAPEGQGEKAKGRRAPPADRS